MATVVGIDLSLTGTGIAVTRNGKLVDTHLIISKGKQDDTLAMRCDRLTAIRARVAEHVTDNRASLVVVEAPSFGSRHGSAHDRSGLWWLTVQWQWLHGIPVAQCPPTNRAKYATGKGGAGKDEVLSDVVRRYVRDGDDFAVKNNNVADAVVLAAMGARHLGQPIEDSLPMTHLKAMDGVEWPL